MEPRIEIEQQPDGFTRHSEIFSDGSRNDAWILGDMWIREYEFHQGYERKNYIAYRIAEPRKAGRLPWTVNNKRLHTHGIFSLNEAKELVLKGAAQ